jgi:hypothetical protein
MPKRYDVTGVSPLNYISQEKNYLLSGANVIPKEGLFFASGFSMVGFSPLFPAGTPLVLGTDYSMSALKEPYSTALGVPIHDKAVLITSGWTSVEIWYHALGTHVYYDATGVATENYFQNERQVLAGRLKMYPVKQVPFFKSTFSAVGFNVANPGGYPLVEGVDFAFGPLVEPTSTALGMDVVEYITLLVHDLDEIEMTLHSMGNYVPYDAYATLPSNYIVDEIQPITDSLMVRPLMPSAFYLQDLVVKGYNLDYPTGKVLQAVLDYKYSPMYLTYSEATAKEVYSYVVLAENIWDSVSFTCRMTGGSVDATLFTEIMLAGSFDKMDPVNWMQFRGQQKTLNVHIMDDDEPGQSFLEVLSYKLVEIKDAIAALPAAPVVSLPSNITNDVTNLITQLTEQQMNVNNAMGLLGQYGVNGPLFKVITDATYTVVDTDIGFTLIFTSPTGCELTINDGLPEGMYFRAVQHVTAGTVQFVGTAERYSTSTINGTTTPGEICYFMKTDTGVSPAHDRFLLDSNRLNADVLSAENKIVTAQTYTVVASDIGKNLIFTNTVSPTTVSVNDNLPEGMNFSIIKPVGAAKVVLSGSSTKVNPAESLEVTTDGQVFSLLMITKAVSPAHDVFLVDNNCSDPFKAIPIVNITASTYTVTSADADKLLIFNHTTGTTVTLNDSLRAGMRFKWSLDDTAGPVTWAGTAVGYPAAPVDLASFTGKNWIEMVKIVEKTTAPTHDVYVSNATIAAPASEAYVDQKVSQAVATVARTCNVRQTVLTGPVDANGNANFLLNVGSELKTTNTLDDFPLVLCFGDGFDEYGERNYIVKVTTTKSWGSGSLINGHRWYYFEYDPDTETLTQGYSTLPPVYTFAKPAFPAEGQWWYPRDHRSCGEAYSGGEWLKKRRVYVAYGNTAMDINFCCYAYQGKGIVEVDPLTLVEGTIAVPFKTDNWSLNLKGQIQLLGAAATALGWEGETILPLPPSTSLNISGNAGVGGFTLSRQQLATLRYRQLALTLARDTANPTGAIYLPNFTTGVETTFYYNVAGNCKIFVQVERDF